MPCARVRAVGFGGLAASPSQDPGVPPPLAGLGPPTQKGIGRAGLGQEGPTWQGPQSLRGPGWEGWVLAGFGLWARAFIRRVS